ncbi:MAG: transposase [Anaerolineales bacterium]|jgi:REP element-mobilizing transposase RayT
MMADLLVVTPQASFGELIRQSLSETGSFRVNIANEKSTAVLAAEVGNYSLALLDTELGEKNVLEIGRSLRSINPDLDLVILSDGELPPSMDAIRPWVLLRKPFYLPDFIQLVRAVPVIPDQLLDAFEENEEKITPGSKEKMEEPTPQNDPQTLDIPWLNDVSKAAQHLTRLTLESSAQAALITREKELWAYAGQLSQNAANELAGTVSRHWDGQKGNDLLRFVRLESTKAEHMLYATSMSTEVILALVFDAETPFSTIRSQANSLARSLAIAKTGPLDSLERTPPPKREQVQVESEADEFEEYDEFDEELDVPSIADILDEIPPPVPAVRAQVDASQMSTDEVDDEVEEDADMVETEMDVDPSAAVTRPSTPLPKKSNRRLSQESSPAIRLSDLIMTDQQVEQDEYQADFPDELAATMPSKSQRRRPATPVRQPAPGELDETRPHSITEVASKMIPEAASPGMAQLNYACLLVPRFVAHYMTGDLADRMSEWMPNICIAFGWRLEFLAVRPDYLQWVVNVTPNTSPGYLMRIMRQQTSEKIFSEFPRLKRDNPSGDFWAPGYLIMGGIQPHPPQLVKDYIKQTRQRQGISQPRRW